jgi:hypothetical protein
MAYYLGRDVHASFTTEHELCGIRVSGGKTYVDNVLIATAASVTNGALGSASNIITCDGAHGLSDGDPVQIIMDNADHALTGANFSADETYYAITFPNANKIALAATRSDAIGFTDSTADYNNGTTIEHDGAVTITAGMFVTHEPGSTGINDELYVASVTDGDTFVLSAATIGGNVTNQTLRFRKPIAFANNSNIEDVNIVRILTGTSDTAFAEDATQSTFVFNREYPTYKVDAASAGAGGSAVADIAEIVADNNTANAAPLHFNSAANRNRISDLVGLDLALDKVDEDIAYFGQRTALKAEVKQGISVTFTRKKSDQRFAVLSNSARHGVKTFTTTAKTADDIDSASRSGSNLTLEGATLLSTADQVHANQNYGYRVHVQLKASEEIIAIRNACITDYTVNLNADGVSEESITFYSNVEPVFDNSTYATLTAEADI